MYCLIGLISQLFRHSTLGQLLLRLFASLQLCLPSSRLSASVPHCRETHLSSVSSYYQFRLYFSACSTSLRLIYLYLCLYSLNLSFCAACSAVRHHLPVFVIGENSACYFCCLPNCVRAKSVRFAVKVTVTSTVNVDRAYKEKSQATQVATLRLCSVSAVSPSSFVCACPKHGIRYCIYYMHI